jgi:hypothetical protein
MEPRKVTALAAVAVLSAALAPSALGLEPLAWEATAGRELSDVATDADGNVYVTGFRWEQGRSVAIVRSYGPDGTVRWRRSWVPPDVDGQPTYTVGREIDVSGGVVAVAGRVAPWFCNAEGWWLRIYTTDGDLQWQRQEPGWRRCEASSWAEAVALDGSSIVFGWNELKGEPFTRGHVRAYELDGTIRWSVEFDDPGFGDVMDGVRDAAITGTGEVLLAGWTRDLPDRNPDGRYHLLVQQLSAATGELIWSQRPGPALRRLVSADSIDEESGTIVVGATLDRPTGRVAWLGSLTATGDVDWTNEWPTTGWETAVMLAPTDSSFVAHRVSGEGDGGADAAIRELDTAGVELSVGRLDAGPSGIDSARIAPIGAGVVVAAAIEPPVGGYVARFG